MTTPASLRRSPVQTALQKMSPAWSTIHNMAAPLRFRDSASEDRALAQLALCDLSCLHKVSVKGPGTVEWVGRMGIQVPESVYAYSHREGDGLVIRTDRNEVFVSDGPFSQRVAEFSPFLLHASQPLQSAPSGVSIVRRQEACFCLAGARANTVLVETCGFDFRNPGNAVVMTRVAGVSCMVLPLEMSGVPLFRLWLDPSYGLYLWEALLEIVHDHGGDAIGLEAVYPSLRNRTH